MDKSALREKKKELLEEIRKLEKEAALLKSELKKLNSGKREVIDKIKRLNTSAEELKTQRNELNSKVKEMKNEKENIKKEIEALFSEYKKQKEITPNSSNFRSLEKEMNRLEWKLQTSVLDRAEEEEMVKKIEQVKSQLSTSKVLIDLMKKIDFEKLRLKRVGVKIARYSAKAQQYHNRFVEVIKEIRKLEEEMEEINKRKREGEAKFASLEKKLKESDSEFKETLAHLGEKEREKIEKEEDALRKMAMSLYEEFKKGKKLTTEDLYLLQRFHLV